MGLNLGLILIPFTICLIAAWFSRRHLLWKDKPIPKGFILLLLVLGLVPVVNIVAGAVYILVLMFNSFDCGVSDTPRVKMKDTKLNRYLSN